MNSIYYRYGKRVFDLFLASLIFFVCWPLMLLVSIAIRLDSPGSVLYLQDRAGRDGKTFRIYKFRSMYRDRAKPALSPRTSDDPRITKVGRILRRLSLDELPQIFNVFKGEMSFVGPRPEMVFITQGYNDEQKQRLAVLPGITGLWQISAVRQEPIHHNLQYDLFYIQQLGFCLDMQILLKTCLVMLQAKNTF